MDSAKAARLVSVMIGAAKRPEKTASCGNTARPAKGPSSRGRRRRPGGRKRTSGAAAATRGEKTMTKAVFAAGSLALLLGGCFDTVSEIANRAKAVASGQRSHAGPHGDQQHASHARWLIHRTLRSGRIAARTCSRTRVPGRVGDVVTVRISIKDQASLNNSTNTKREATRELNITNTMNLTYTPGNTNVQSRGSWIRRSIRPRSRRGRGRSSARRPSTCLSARLSPAFCPTAISW